MSPPIAIFISFLYPAFAIGMSITVYKGVTVSIANSITDIALSGSCVAILTG